MTPGSSVEFGLGDQQSALDSHGHSKGMTGLLAEVAAQHVAGPGDAHVPGAASSTGTLTDPRPPAVVGFL
jgi:hypothetical protein